jgi:hypothetical protein
MLLYAMNVICLPDRALTSDLAPVSQVSLLSRFGRNICTAMPSPETLVGLIPLALCRSSGGA